MKTTYSVLFAAFAGLALTLTGCSKDKENPTITLESPAEHSHFDRGTTMHVTLMVEDDKELSKIELEMANQDGSHNHDFHFSDTENISGTEYEWHGMIDIPATAPDMMWLHVTVTDEKGNEATDAIMYHFDN